MENKKDGGPSFPMVESSTNSQHELDEVWSAGGMSLRDYFAAKAMQSLISAIEKESDVMDITRNAYGLADLMVKERSK